MTQSNSLGVALTRCYFCNEGHQIVMNRVLTPHLAAKVEEMNGKIIDMTPCSKCADFMKQGVILITIDPEKSGKDWNRPPDIGYDYRDKARRENWMPNPYRTGGWFVVKDEAITRMFAEDAPELAAWAIKHRFMFIEHEAAKGMGLFAEGERMNKEAGTGKEESKSE